MVGHGLELVEPFLRRHDGLGLDGLGVDLVSLGICMLDDLVEIVGEEAVEHVEEVEPIRQSITLVDFAEVLLQVLVVLYLWPDRLHGELVQLGDLDVVDVGLLEQLLLFCQNLLEILLIHMALWRDVVSYKRWLWIKIKYLLR